MRLELLIRLVPVLLGILGFAVAWGAWHLVLDHALLHQLVTIEQVRQTAPK